MHRLPVYAAALIFLLAGLISCRNKETVSVRLLKQAHETFRSNPKQALVLLDSIAYPENLDAKQNALWCMLKGKIADTLHTDLPYSHQLERAARYYRRKGNANEKARILLYLGRAYVEDGNYEDAMHTYLKALESGLSAGNYNLTGYINSYTGDLYYKQSSYDMALEKYLSAAAYFKKANNVRSQSFAYRDAGRTCYFKDSLNQALQFMKQAYSILSPSNDSTGIADIFNGIGNIHIAKGDYEKAEYYLKKGIEYDPKESAPDYLALSYLAIRKGDINKAHHYLNKIDLSAVTPYTYADCFYFHYEIEKAAGHTGEALAHLEHYVTVQDSIRNNKARTDLSVLEEKYNHAKISMTNYKLKKERQQVIYFCILIILCSGIVIILYQLTLKRKALALSQRKHDIIFLKNEMSSLKQILLNKENELENLSNLLEEQKKQNHFETTLQQTQAVYRQKLEEIESLNRQLDEKHQKMLQEAPIIKRVQKLAAQVVPNASKSPLSKKDWQMIYELVDTVYPHIATYCQHAGLDEQEERLCYLSIFDLGTAGEAVLLNYTVGTVNKYRQNARRKLHINNRNLSLHEFLVNR